MLYQEVDSAPAEAGYDFVSEPETSLDVSYAADTSVISRRSRPQAEPETQG